MPIEFPYRISPVGDFFPLTFTGAVGGAAPFPLADGRVLWVLDGVTVSGDGLWNWLLETFPDGSVNPHFNPGPFQDVDLPWPVFALALNSRGDVMVPGATGLRTNMTTGAVAYEQDLLRLDSSGEPRGGFTAAASAPDMAFRALMASDDDRILAAGGLISEVGRQARRWSWC